MGTQENLAAAKAGYAAFAAGDLEGAIGAFATDGTLEIHGEHKLSGTVRGHDEIRELFLRLGEKGMTNGPSRYIADGDTVVAFNHAAFGDERADTVEVVDFDSQARIVRFQTFGAEALLTRVYG